MKVIVLLINNIVVSFKTEELFLTVSNSENVYTYGCLIFYFFLQLFCAYVNQSKQAYVFIIVKFIIIIIIVLHSVMNVVSYIE